MFNVETVKDAHHFIKMYYPQLKDKRCMDYISFLSMREPIEIRYAYGDIYLSKQLDGTVWTTLPTDIARADIHIRTWVSRVLVDGFGYIETPEPCRLTLKQLLYRMPLLGRHQTVCVRAGIWCIRDFSQGGYYVCIV